MKTSERVRIISGTLRKHLIRFEHNPQIRPTPDRVRETLFNWLTPYITQAKCLDLFAGSAVLGLESLSRGAQSCTLIEKNKTTCHTIQNNLDKLQLTHESLNSQVELCQADALYWLNRSKQQTDLTHPFDIIYIDPPYQSDLLDKSCQILNESMTEESVKLLHENSLIYLESDQYLDKHNLPKNWHAYKKDRYGQVHFGLYYPVP